MPEIKESLSITELSRRLNEKKLGSEAFESPVFASTEKQPKSTEPAVEIPEIVEPPLSSIVPEDAAAPTVDGKPPVTDDSGFTIIELDQVVEDFVEENTGRSESSQTGQAERDAIFRPRPWAAAAAGIALSVGMYFGSGSLLRTYTENSYSSTASALSQRLLRVSDGYLAAVLPLADLMSLGKSSGGYKVEFEQLSKSLLARASGARTIFWVERVKSDQRSELEKRMHSGDRPDFAVFDINPYGEQVTAPVRGEYAPIVYAQGLSAEALEGRDLWTHSALQSVMNKAVRTGTAAATEKRPLLNGKSEQGFLVFQPVYRRGSVLNGYAERQENLLGWIGLQISLSNLAADFFKSLSTESTLEDKSRLSVAVYEQFGPEKKGVLFTGATLNLEGDFAADEIAILREASAQGVFGSKKLQFLDRDWHVLVVREWGMMANVLRFVGEGLLALGLLLTGLVFRSQRKARKQIDRLTRPAFRKAF